jgi:hypothetical protein
MYRITWKTLVEKEATLQPYRGNKNRYPLMDRSQNTKCFYIKDLDGEKVYSITHGYRHIPTYHTKEEYDHDQKIYGNKSNINYYSHQTDLDKQYVSWKPIPYEIGIVRSDNTFEFTTDHLSASENMFLSNLSRGYFFTDSKRGGVMYSVSYQVGEHSLAVFKGLRINCDTMMPHESSEYKITGYRVNRKESKKLLAKYTEFFKVNEAMIKVIPTQGLMETGVDVFKSCDVKTDEYYWLHDGARTKLLEFAENNINSSPLESLIAYACAFDVKNSYRKIVNFMANDTSSSYNTIDGVQVLEGFRRTLTRKLYKEHKEIFKQVDFNPYELLPPSDWGYTITVNGVEVDRY